MALPTALIYSFPSNTDVGSVPPSTFIPSPTEPEIYFQYDVVQPGETFRLNGKQTVYVPNRNAVTLNMMYIANNFNQYENNGSKKYPYGEAIDEPGVSCGCFGPDTAGKTHFMSDMQQHNLLNDGNEGFVYQNDNAPYRTVPHQHRNSWSEPAWGDSGGGGGGCAIGGVDAGGGGGGCGGGDAGGCGGGCGGD